MNEQFLISDGKPYISLLLIRNEVSLYLANKYRKNDKPTCHFPLFLDTPRYLEPLNSALSALVALSMFLSWPLITISSSLKASKFFKSSSRFRTWRSSNSLSDLSIILELSAVLEVGESRILN